MMMSTLAKSRFSPVVPTLERSITRAVPSFSLLKVANDSAFAFSDMLPLNSTMSMS